MKKTLLIFLQFIFCLSIHAQKLPQKKLNNKELKSFFLENYGNNDTSRAVIEFYFLKRKELKKGIILGGSIGLLTTYPLLSYTPPKTGYPDDYSSVIIGAVSIVAAYSALTSIYSGIIIHKYNGEHLLKTLELYKANSVLPKWILRNPNFKRFLPNSKSKFFLFR